MKLKKTNKKIGSIINEVGNLKKKIWSLYSFKDISWMELKKDKQTNRKFN